MEPQKGAKGTSALPKQTAKDYFRINIYYPFIDHVVGELEHRFDSSKHAGLIAANGLVPKNLESLQRQSTEDILSYYGKSLKNEERLNLEVEIEEWQVQLYCYTFSFISCIHGDVKLSNAMVSSKYFNSHHFLYLRTEVGDHLVFERHCQTTEESQKSKDWMLLVFACSNNKNKLTVLTLVWEKSILV